jgi:hypothetical protein
MNDLDPGIRDVVAFLRLWEFKTTDSGDGVTKRAAGWSENEAADYPHVHMMAPPSRLIAEAQRLVKVLAVNGVGVSPCGEGAVHIQATYDPANESAILSLIGLNDAMLGAALESLRAAAAVDPVVENTESSTRDKSSDLGGTAHGE